MSFFASSGCRTPSASPQPPHPLLTGVQPLPLVLSWIVPCANLRCFYWPSGEHVLCPRFVPWCPVLTTGVCDSGGGKEGAASVLLEAMKLEELLQKNLLLLEKFWVSGKQSINDYSASFLQDFSFTSVFQSIKSFLNYFRYLFIGFLTPWLHKSEQWHWSHHLWSDVEQERTGTVSLGALKPVTVLMLPQGPAAHFSAALPATIPRLLPVLSAPVSSVMPSTGVGQGWGGSCFTDLHHPLTIS